MSNGEHIKTIGVKVSEGSRDATPPLVLDPARYAAHLDDFDLSDAQKAELLATLWSIMCSFVALGFSADIVSTVFPTIDAIPDDDELG